MVHFKTAGIKDIALIRTLAKAIWPATYAHILTPAQSEYMMDMMYSTTSLQHQLTVQNHHYIIAYDDEKEAGFASWSGLKGKNRYKLHKIYVMPGMQGKGVGKKIIEQVIAEIGASIPAVLELNVNRGNSARDFYIRQGFSIVREEDIAIGNGFFMNDYVMQKLIGAEV